MKLLSQTRLVSILKSKRQKKQSIVFTNGCFDILHVGHVRYLKKAKSLGNVLVVGLNSDASVRGLKGAGRPVNSERERSEVVAALEFVDYVTIFSQATPLQLIQKIRPEYLVKGGDWDKSRIVGSGFVQSYGGKTLSLPFVKGYSTTRVLGAIRKS